MKPFSEYNKLLYIVTPLLIAILIFGLIRLSYDVTISGNYLHHSGLFILSELVSTIGGAYLCFYFTEKWVDFVLTRKVPVVIEYMAITLITLSIVMLVMALSHHIEGKSLSVREIIAPAVVAVLVEFWVYLWIRISIVNKKYQISQLNNERIRNEQLIMEMKLLQAQYHPHFLFNMLNTIYFRIHEDNQEARDAVEHLSNLLRGQLYQETGKVPLDRELAVMTSYIELSRLRFGDKLRLNVEIDNCAKGLMIYPYLLLPLVENAFKHVGGNYSIDISFHSDNETVELTVRNSIGVNHYEKTAHKGIGLQNLRRQLELLYGNNSYLLESFDSDGFHNSKFFLKI